MGSRGNSAVAVNVTRLKREDCGRTKHDSAFSDWKVLIGPSDWEDYSAGKEGAARYRVHNLPTSSNPGLYELGAAVARTKSGREIRKLEPSHVIMVYIGQADCVRTRLQQYGRTGAHLGNCSSSAHQNEETCSNKQAGLFSDILLRGHSIVFRWAPMNNKEVAVRMEALLLNTFDYAWNKGSNGARRPSEIIQKLEEASSARYRVSSAAKNLLPFLQKKVGKRILKLKGNVPSLETKSDPQVEGEKNFHLAIFKFSRSKPRVVLDRSCMNEDGTGSCGVSLGDGNICRRPPVKGRKRCAQHKGMKVNIQAQFADPIEQVMTDQGPKDPMSRVGKVHLHPANLSSATETFNPVICGFILGDGSPCRKPPVQGRKRCSAHRGRRIATKNSVPSWTPEINYAHNMGQGVPENSVVGRLEARILSKRCDSSNSTSVCGVDFGDGTFCTRQPARGRVRCEYHKGMRVSRSRIYDTR